MKNKKKYIFLLMTVIFVLSLHVPVTASSPEEAEKHTDIQPLWQNVSEASAELIFNGTTANCSTVILGLAGTTSITATMRLERVSGNTVTTVATWTSTASSSRLVMNESATVTANGTYRLRVDATVVRNGVSEVISISG